MAGPHVSCKPFRPARVPKGPSPPSAQVTLVIPSGPGSTPAYVPLYPVVSKDQNDIWDSCGVGLGLWLWASAPGDQL